MARKDDLVDELDVGTTKICVIVAEATENGIDIVGIGTHPSRGLRKGLVVDIDATVNSIKHNVDLDDGWFDLPEEVKKLREES